SLLNPRVLGTTARELMRNRYHRILARQELNSARAYDRILTNSRYSRESMLKAYGIDAGVCYLGIDAELFRPTGAERTRTVVGVGSFDRIKNIEFVIRAVALLDDLRPRLVWIGNSGEAAYQEELPVLAESLGVDYSPRLMISDAEMVEILNTACVMAYAPRLEPFGLTPLEANCCGLPVVGVAEGGVRESISHGNNGLLVDAEPAAMAGALRTFLEDPQGAAEFGRRARAWVLEHWSMPAAIDRLESFFERTARSEKT
ncbi:MAG: glycosyltransferase family 4 protein, partial [Gammaproteobacteria bacterium]|nr:glycosyltransferase family 4 protein [Gammaproteobacteria bacterium]